ncbi:response regulator transcription factor [Actinophytocola algeriensis]|jgi:DNA-binding NarL/FixJ family response regulator|uniref:DNA-binding NarL/FixJ family response regulator n=1 Tax=Actinophytocola algeriensis TaxID=1768010 RepID=A0A7W7QA11_9PSEU|nr:response regulator transcription factor [Actinophytocola algeriensis]MBB4909800.1 DNA-binding NarL/FixJ family response regulator [Actinophytocola algeriensis]MBE1475790.1 DNA-binding NarL/FixJ family response regulator [Actinophytocola algeriensis]
MTYEVRVPLRVLVADDDPMIRLALSEVLDAEADLQVVAIAEDAVQAVSLAETHGPDVAVLDVRMPGGGGAHAAREIRVRSPRTQLLAFSAYDDSGTVDELKRLGVREYLIKGVTNAEIVAAVRRAGAAVQA